MRAPEFWARDGALPRLLTPLGQAYHLAGVLRRRLTTPWRAPVPVLCVGNLVAGGAGKTPVALALIAELKSRGLKPAALTRGYGGSVAGPLQVDPDAHGAAMVGDEALLLADAAPTWVVRDRAAGARAAVAGGADVIVMDDGFQNPGLHKDLSFVVVDGAAGFGNGRVIPAGPLRENLRGGLARADAVVIVGDDRIAAEQRALLADLPILAARLEPSDRSLSGVRVFAFAGIGRPEKFFETLRALGAELTGCEAFADHQPYSADTLARLRAAAGALDARLVTTAKDAARLRPAMPQDITVLDVTLAWDDKQALRRLLASVLPAGREDPSPEAATGR